MNPLRALHARDRPLWRAARSMSDLRDLTAGWLHGRIAAQPAYHHPVDVDEPDAPGLTDTLVALNQAGYLTTSSQAGYDGPGYRGAHCQQHAAVEGFATDDTTRWLEHAVAGTEYRIVEHGCKPHPWQRSAPGADVTFLDGQPVTHFGRQTSHAGIAHDRYPGVHPAAVHDVAVARQITIYDPTPGRNTIWPQLRQAADEHLPTCAAAPPPAQDTNDDADGW